MKLGKKAKKLEITNPFRPPQQFERNYTVCRITQDSLLSVDPDVYKLQVDADYVKDFADGLSLIPNPHKYYCSILDMWFLTEDGIHGECLQERVINLARKYFDEVHVHYTDNSVFKIKERTNDTNTTKT